MIRAAITPPTGPSGLWSPQVYEERGSTPMVESKFARLVFPTLVLMIALATGEGSAQALASSTLGCTVYDVEADAVSNSSTAPRIFFHCVNDGNLYSVNDAPCFVVSADLAKQYSSMLTSALLSGKKLDLWWDNACGTRAITGMHLLSGL
jgi:hypothetical protein